MFPLFWRNIINNRIVFLIKFAYIVCCGFMIISHQSESVYYIFNIFFIIGCKRLFSRPVPEAFDGQTHGASIRSCRTLYASPSSTILFLIFPRSKNSLRPSAVCLHTVMLTRVVYLYIKKHDSSCQKKEIQRIFPGCDRVTDVSALAGCAPPQLNFSNVGEYSSEAFIWRATVDVPKIRTSVLIPSLYSTTLRKTRVRYRKYTEHHALRIRGTEPRG